MKKKFFSKKILTAEKMSETIGRKPNSGLIPLKNCCKCGILEGGTRIYRDSEDNGYCYCCYSNLNEGKPISDPNSCRCFQHYYFRNKDAPLAHVFATTK